MSYSNSNFSNVPCELGGEDSGCEARIWRKWLEESAHDKIDSDTKTNINNDPKVSGDEVGFGQQLKDQWYKKDKEVLSTHLSNRQRGKKVHYMLFYFKWLSLTINFKMTI